MKIIYSCYFSTKINILSDYNPICTAVNVFLRNTHFSSNKRKIIRENKLFINNKLFGYHNFVKKI